MATIQELEKKIEELEQYIKDKKTRQISLPLDIVSTGIIQKDLPVYLRTVLGAVAVGGYITVNINGLPVNILIK